MGLLSTSQFPAQLLPTSASTPNAEAAQSQKSNIDNDPAIDNKFESMKGRDA